MLVIIHKVNKVLGIDRAISYILMGKLVALGAQPLVLLLVSKYLNVVEQGFYFTFNNILSLSVFFELGLGTILTQFASYEFAALQWQNGLVQGATASLDRLFSLIRQALRWYLGMALVFVLCIVPGGILFFHKSSSAANVSYIIPWVILVLATALNLVCYAFTSLLEGCRRIDDVQFVKMIQSVTGSLAICMFLYAKLGLFASAAFACVQLLVMSLWL